MEALKNWLLMGALLAVAFLSLELYRAETGPPPTTPAAAVAVPAASPAPARVQTSAPAADPRAGDLVLQEELHRYQVGLEKCVAALNATAAASQRREARTFVLSAPPRAAAADIVDLAEAFVLPSGDSVVVSGRLFNRGSADGNVTLVVTLHENGHPRETQQQRLSVGAGKVIDWQQSFRWDGHEAMWSARVEVLP